LQNLGPTACQATLTIEGLEDQPRRFGDVSGFSSRPSAAIQLGLFQFKPLSIVTGSRIRGWG
jgi:hypothetical protein